MPVLALGVSYRRADVDLLERLSFAEHAEPKAYRRLLEAGAVREAVILSTCNRVEVYAEVDQYHPGFQAVKRFLAEDREVALEALSEPLYSHYQDLAVEHLFSVAAGLDSMVVGEPQILSQVRAAFRRSESEGAAGPELGALFRAAVRAGRAARSRTGIGAAPGAMVRAGLGVAAGHLGGLAGRAALVIGAGEMGALAAGALRDVGAAPITVLNRTPRRAARVAERIGASHGGLDRLAEALDRADLAVAATDATGVVVSRRMLEGRSRPLFLLDLGVPRDVEPTAGGLPGVWVADIGALRGPVAEAGEAVRDEVHAAREVVDEEVRRFVVTRRTRRLAPLIEALHARGETIRAEEIARLGARLHRLSERDRQAVDAVTRRIIRRLLHDPVVRLKDLAGRGEAGPAAAALGDLFGLEPED